MELGAGAGFEVVDEARECAHGEVAAPAGDRGSCVLRHVLFIVSTSKCTMIQKALTIRKLPSCGV